MDSRFQCCGDVVLYEIDTNKVDTWFARHWLPIYMRKWTCISQNTSSRYSLRSTYSTTPDRWSVFTSGPRQKAKIASFLLQNYGGTDVFQSFQFLHSLIVVSSFVRHKDCRFVLLYSTGTLTSLCIQLVCKTWPLLLESAGLPLRSKTIAPYMWHHESQATFVILPKRSKGF